MKRLSLLLALAPLLVFAAEPKREPAETVEQAREAAKLVVVSEWTDPIPDPKTNKWDAIKACWKIEPRARIEVTTTAWHEKWDIFADRLVLLAEEKRLDGNSLKRCLIALKRGALIQTQPQRIESPLSVEQMRQMSSKEGEDGSFTIEISGYPGGHIDTLPASVPTSAFLVHSSDKSFWVIFAPWEYEEIGEAFQPADEQPQAKSLIGMNLTHIRFWVMDTATCDILIYSSCD
jgi:hypothetical protein